MAKAALFEPIRVRNSNLSNRIVIAPMCQYSAENGCMTDWHLIHLGHLSLSGAALLTTEATAVLLEGRITYADVGLELGQRSQVSGKRITGDDAAVIFSAADGRRRGQALQGQSPSLLET
jgi:2,4-dienoyl-CoA reductase-like NADH-dependent reductase (Old Yellow Enzyme family)